MEAQCLSSSPKSWFSPTQRRKQCLPEAASLRRLFRRKGQETQRTSKAYFLLGPVLKSTDCQTFTQSHRKPFGGPPQTRLQTSPSQYHLPGGMYYWANTSGEETELQECYRTYPKAPNSNLGLLKAEKPLKTFKHAIDKNRYAL